MSLSTSKITELAPDQESLNAANKLMKPNKWPYLSQHDHLVWGECQGSGANPYRTVFDHINIGYKCTCPSRKFPCKHVLALMWMFTENPSAFSAAEVPAWVSDWLGRRRNTDGSNSTKPQNPSPSKAKSLIAAQLSEPEKSVEPETEARRKAAVEKRAVATKQSIAAGLIELQQWVQDQLRGGLANLLNDPTSRCRTIAARLVDAKAQAMASRLDEFPSKLLSIPSEGRLDWLVQELGRIVLICRAWSANPNDAELTRLVGSSETRESILSLVDAPRVSSIWEVVGEQVSTRRDGLVSQATWLMNLRDGLCFALLLDYFPASLGKRSSAFMVGEQFAAELAFYPSRFPMRAVIVERKLETAPISPIVADWPIPCSDLHAAYRNVLKLSPWSVDVPLLLPKGALVQSGSQVWWQSENRSIALPVLDKPQKSIMGLELHKTAALWDGMSLKLLSGQSQWGAWSYDN